MKNRRIAIVAFLLIATLVMGVGYAAITGNLTINGTAAYTPEQVVNDATVKFHSYQAVSNCSASVQDQTATMTVHFMDNDGTADTVGKVYTAQAKYTVSYTGADGSLSDVMVQATPAVLGDPSVAGFEVTYAWTNDDRIVAVGETIELTVTVKYTVQDPVPTAGVEQTFTISMSYAPNVVTGA